jgi:DNA-binding NarL/FixJ family response regulator
MNENGEAKDGSGGDVGAASFDAPEAARRDVRGGEQRSMTKPYRIVLAEDHTIVREGLKAILAMEADLQVVDEATDGFEAIRCVGARTPDIVLLDLSMPRLNGMEAIEEIKRVSPATRVVVLTVHKSEEYVLAALRAGADGYVLKEATAAELALGIRSVLQGHRYLSPQVSATVIDGYLGAAKEMAPRSSLDELTKREREVLKLIAEGYRSREVAQQLCISPKTVEKHRSNLMSKLDLHSVQALTAYAIERGLVTT